MGKRELKEQNKDLEFNMVDILAMFDPSDNNKFTGFLVKEFKKYMNQNPKKEIGRPIRLRRRPPNKDGVTPVGNNIIERHLISMVENVIGNEHLTVLHSFASHLSNHRIEDGKRDINQYNNWDDLVKVVALADIKYQEKKYEKEVIRMLETDEWLAIRPLTIESSLTYGAGTKWCTASKNNREYFYRYCKNGVLTYIINKNNGDKYGIYLDHNSDEFSIWNPIDRRIDSVESTIPHLILSEIYKISKSEKPNLTYFSESEYERAQDYIRYEEKMAIPVMEDPIDMPDMDEDLAPVEMAVPMNEELGEVIELGDEGLRVVWQGEMHGEERVYEEIREDIGNEREY